MSAQSPIVAALLAELDDGALDELAARLAPRLAAVTTVTSGPLTTSQAARAAGVHERTIRRALSAGTLDGSTVAGRWRIEPQTLDLWVRHGAPTSTTPTHHNGRRTNTGSTGADAIAGTNGRAA